MKEIVSTTTCHYCGLESENVDLGSYKKALCPRCFSPIHYKHTSSNYTLALIFAITSLILFIPANIYPVFTFELAGNEFSATFVQMAVAFHNQGFDFVSIVVLLTAIVFPIVNSLAVVLIYFYQNKNLQFVNKNSINKVYNFTKTASFIEVYLLAFLVGYIKLVDISDVYVHEAILFFIGYIIFFLLSIRKIHSTQEYVIHKKINNSYSKSLSLVIAGFILYIPANYFIMMNISKFGLITPDTIMSGIISLATNNMLHIAIIVFIASIVIPLFKLVGMLFILLCVQYNFFKNKIALLKLYKFIEAIGKWSILDIYMVALLISYVKDESIAYIETGSAATFFTMVVIVTMLATSLFDTKLIWNKNE